MTSSIAPLGDVQFVSLTTFRKSGQPVPTTVWIALDGDALIVTTPKGSGKVKRVQRDPRVELRPSGRRRQRADDTYLVTGVAEIVDDDAVIQRCNRAFGAKYGWQFRIAMLVERFSGGHQRVLLRIKAA